MANGRRNNNNVNLIASINDGVNRLESKFDDISGRISEASDRLLNGFTNGISGLSNTLQSSQNTNSSNNNNSSSSVAIGRVIVSASQSLGSIDRNVATIVRLMQSMASQNGQSQSNIPQPTVAPPPTTPPSTSGGSNISNTTSNTTSPSATGLQSMGDSVKSLGGKAVAAGVKGFGAVVGASVQVFGKVTEGVISGVKKLYSAVDKLTGVFADFATKGFDNTVKDFGSELIGQIPLIGKLLAAVWSKGIDNMSKGDQYSTQFARENGGGRQGKSSAQGIINSTRSKYIGKDGTLTNEKIGQAMTEHAKASGGRESKLTSQDLFDTIQLNKFNVNAQDLSKFSDMGMNAGNTKKLMEDIYKDASKKGLSFQKVSENVKNNLGMAQKYTFKDGVKGLTRMAEQSASLKTNMQMASNFADKVSSLSGATEASAQLSVLGGNFANQANPLTMMSNSLLDFEEFNKSIDETLKGFAQFKDGQYTMSTFNKQQLKAYAQATGMDYEDLYNRSVNGQKMEDIKAQAGGKLSDAALQYVMNQGQMDENGNAYISDDNGNRVDINNMSEDQVSALEQKAADSGKSEKDWLENIYNATMSNNEKMEAMFNQFVEKFMGFITPIYEWLTQNLEPIMNGVFDFVESVAMPIINDVIAPVLKNVVMPFISDVLVPLVKEVAPVITSALATFVDELMPLFTDTILPFLTDFAIPFITDLVKFYSEVLEPIIKGISDAVKDVLLPFLSGPYADFINEMKPVIKEIFTTLGEAISPLLKIVVDLMKVIMPFMTPIYTVLSKALKIVGKGVDWLATICDEIVNFFKPVGDFISNSSKVVGDAIDSALSWIGLDSGTNDAEVDKIVGGGNDNDPNAFRFTDSTGNNVKAHEGEATFVLNNHAMDTYGKEIGSFVKAINGGQLKKDNQQITPNYNSDKIYANMPVSPSKNNVSNSNTKVGFEPLNINISGTLKIDLGQNQGQIDGNKLLNNPAFINALADKIAGPVGTKFMSMQTRSVPKETLMQNGQWFGY